MHNISITKSAEIPAESLNSVSFPNNKSAIPNPNLSVAVEDEYGSVDYPAESPKIFTPLSKLDSKLSRPFPYLTVEVKALAVENAESVAENPKKEMTVSKRNEKIGAPEVIELSDDDDGEATSRLFCDQPERPLREYLDPQGAVQGPTSLLTMKHWADADYFPSGFLVWKAGSPQIKFALAEVLRQSFLNHHC
uniref:GYF domain-containing protein n=1 Tax=Kalanchoe fedtschenkoi TaxID=63787 RepID=A0A7N0VI15_KALFE